MTEKEKMLAGMEYFPSDTQLVEETTQCKALCHEYNQKTTNDIKTVLPNTGENVTVLQPFWCDYGYNITLGYGVFINHNCVILDGGKVTIGNNTLIGPNCGLYTAIHPLDSIKRRTGIESSKPITIGNDVWLGGGVTVLPGVTIGDNVVIGAGSVVTKDIPDNVVAAGNPCKVIKENPLQ